MPTHTPPHLCPLPLGGDFLWSVLGKQFCKYSPGIFLSHFKNPSPKKNFRKKNFDNFLTPPSPFSISPRKKNSRKKIHLFHNPLFPFSFSLVNRKNILTVGSHLFLMFIFFLWLTLYLRRSDKKEEDGSMTFIVSLSSSFFLLCVLFMHVILQRVHYKVYEFIPRVWCFFFTVTISPDFEYWCFQLFDAVCFCHKVWE